jgi:hypothetical protein
LKLPADAAGNALAFAVQIAADLAKLYTSFMEQKGENWCQSLNCELNFPLFTIQALTP